MDIEYRLHNPHYLGGGGFGDGSAASFRLSVGRRRRGVPPCQGSSLGLPRSQPFPRNDNAELLNGSARIKIPAASKLSFVREIKEKEWQAINNCGKLENFLKKLKKVEKSVSKQLD